MYRLFNGQTSNGTSEVIQLIEAGPATESWSVQVTGVLDTATVDLQLAPSPDGPWLAPSDASFTSTGWWTSPASRMLYARAVLSSAGASTDVTVYVG